MRRPAGRRDGAGDGRASRPERAGEPARRGAKRGASPPPGDELLAFHHDCLLFDGHNDLALRVLDGEDPSVRGEAGHLDLPRMREGGFDGGVFAVWTPPAESRPLARTLARVERFRGWLERADGVRLVLRAEDLERAADAGEVAAILGVEGGYGIADDLEAADALFGAGVRCLTLTWTEPTAWADAAGAEPEHGGLTEFGARLVGRLQALGVAVDVSHASDAAVQDVLDVAAAPVTASHSALRSLCDRPRNLPDGLLEELASAGGVLGVNFFPGYLDPEAARIWERVRRRAGEEAFGEPGRRAFRRRLRAADGTVGLERLALHLERAVEVAGPDAVGLGSDFDGVPALPAGLDDAGDLPRLTALLEARGVPRPTLRGVLGENFVRFFAAVLP